jgi:energy-coupling factor transport system permease protein
MKLAVGQYIPSNSIIHRMDPRVKILCNILFIVIIFLSDYYITGAIIFFPILLIFFAAQIQARKLLSLLKPAIFLLFFLFIINIFILHDNKDVYLK